MINNNNNNNDNDDRGASKRPPPAITQKAWDPALESQIRKKWTDENTYEFVMAQKGHNYVIDTPPPYPSGRPWHIGAAAHYSQIDMIARTARMAGKNVYFPIGIDRNGLPVEIYTEKKQGIRMRETPRREFLEMCRESLDDLESEMVEIMDGLGLCGDIANRYRTDTPEYRALTQATFIKMWKEGDVYLANRPNNYDWVSGTTIADAEIAYEEIPSKLVYMRFEVRDKSNANDNDNDDDDPHIIVASTRPELLCACRAVIVNPKDERYAKYIGQDVIVPVAGHAVHIHPHPSARAEFGSGAVMVCSYGDQNDVSLFRELKLQEVKAIGLDGRMTEAAGPYARLRPKQARAKITEDMKEAGAIIKTEDIIHRTPVAERSRNPIEIIPMEEYYLRQVDHTDRIRELAENIIFHPPMHKQVLYNWLESINMDWPISRRRYYSTEIPVWRCKSCGEVYVPEPGKYYIPWAQECPAKSCAACGRCEFEGEERTFDTWMDSSISPLFIAGYRGKDIASNSTTSDDDDDDDDSTKFEKMYPASIRPQAKDIIRTWLYYTLLRCEKITGMAPWSEAWIMGYGLDEHGLKMSKSKGNAIDPLPVIRRLGADTFRFWNASEVNHGYDFRCNEQKIESAKKFLSKLWNVSRFLSSFEVPRDADGQPDLLMSQEGNPCGYGMMHEHNDNDKDYCLQAADRWILAELDCLVSQCSRGYAEYNFFIPAIAIREFTWNVFAAHYIEMAKARAYGVGFSDRDCRAAVKTLHTVLHVILRLLAPITPFITEYLWQKMYAAKSGKSIHKEMHPITTMTDTHQKNTEKDKDQGDAASADNGNADDSQTSDMTKTISEFNSMVWNEKKSRGLSLKDGISIGIPDVLEQFGADLRAMHNITQS